MRSLGFSFAARLGFAFACTLLAPAQGSTAGFSDLEIGGSAIVKEIVDGDTVVLDPAVDGRTVVRLVGIQAPKLPLDRPNFPTWPLADEAKSALEHLVLNKKATLGFGGQRTDRHGRHLAHLQTDEGLWVQGAMLRQGMARVYTFADNRARAREMLAIEAEARAARRGIWNHPYYAIRTPESVARDIGTFQIVEGQVVDAAKAKGRIYLNFGPDWRTDFTASLSTEAARQFPRQGIEPLSLKGRQVQVRGWVTKSNGPAIEVTHPEQIQILDK
ncbi:MAG: thermonuclease family protein [Rhodospirillales bacterium]|nr:thermonuclease family protein [Rhodospirillales bacterium]